ncbi:amidase [Celeribacter litoreus]|uniref:amidase n=1 Tax=Celeribacter litoreus TaxID=2876714 RepID=UPI001CCEBC30|nr:amidase [Celeribacter litoreus]MCA0042518.1 amidase [Celeribacter litoreus]
MIGASSSKATEQTVSVLARTEAALARISAENDRDHIFISVCGETALEEARAADARALEGKSFGPLDGKLVAVKDNLAVKGLPHSAGTKALSGVIAGADALSVAALRVGGAVVLGTLNMHEGALGATNDNPFYGKCANPLAEGFTPGGSSGGSGAAVAAGLVDLALGTDTMGSVRIPSAYCGTFGLKPTDGLVPRDGLAFLCTHLDCIGPLSDDPALLLPALQLMATGTAEANDPLRLLPPDGCADEGVCLDGLRILCPTEINETDSEPEVLAAMERAAAYLKACGAEVARAPLGDWTPSHTRRGGLLLIEADGARIFADELANPESALSEDFKALLSYGASASAPRLAEAMLRIQAAGAMVHRALAAYDMILLPTAPQRAFRFGEPVPANQADFTSLANFAACPAVACPVAASDEGLPASVQLIGRPWSDTTLCRVAETLSPLAENVAS